MFMDLNAEEKLIVDPQKMMNDGYGDLGKMMGFIIARYVERFYWYLNLEVKKERNVIL